MRLHTVYECLLLRNQQVVVCVASVKRRLPVIQIGCFNGARKNASSNSFLSSNLTSNTNNTLSRRSVCM